MTAHEQLLDLQKQRNEALEMLEALNRELVKFQLSADIWKTQLGPKKTFVKGRQKQMKFDQLYDQKQRLDTLIGLLSFKMLRLIDEIKQERDALPSSGCAEHA